MNQLNPISNCLLKGRMKAWLVLGIAGLGIAYHAKPAVREQAMISIESGGMERALEVLRP